MASTPFLPSMEIPLDTGNWSGRPSAASRLPKRRGIPKSAGFWPIGASWLRQCSKTCAGSWFWKAIRCVKSPMNPRTLSASWQSSRIRQQRLRCGCANKGALKLTVLEFALSAVISEWRRDV